MPARKKAKIAASNFGFFSVRSYFYLDLFQLQNAPTNSHQYAPPKRDFSFELRVSIWRFNQMQMLPGSVVTFHGLALLVCKTCLQTQYHFYGSNKTRFRSIQSPPRVFLLVLGAPPAVSKPTN
jgi:hypothetical protein